MTLLPHVWWLPAVLAAALLLDVALSLRPPLFICDCLDGVGFPRDWWWSLVVIKATAVVGLVAGIWVPGVAFAANTGVIVYFVSAAVAHVRARFTGGAFWINCLGMLALAVAVQVLSYVV